MGIPGQRRPTPAPWALPCSDVLSGQVWIPKHIQTTLPNRDLSEPPVYNAVSLSPLLLQHQPLCAHGYRYDVIADLV